MGGGTFISLINRLANHLSKLQFSERDALKPVDLSAKPIISRKQSSFSIKLMSWDSARQLAMSLCHTDIETMLIVIAIIWAGWWQLAGWVSACVNVKWQCFIVINWAGPFLFPEALLARNRDTDISQLFNMKLTWNARFPLCNRWNNAVAFSKTYYLCLYPIAASQEITKSVPTTYHCILNSGLTGLA